MDGVASKVITECKTESQSSNSSSLLQEVKRLIKDKAAEADLVVENIYTKRRP